MSTNTYASQLAKVAEEARALFREDAPRSPAEVAALQVIEAHKWALWHAHDRDLAVMLLLSRKDLLRDREYEQHLDQFAVANAEAVARDRRADAASISALCGLIEQACSRLEAGDSPAEVAPWLRNVQQQ